MANRWRPPPQAVVAAMVQASAIPAKVPRSVVAWLSPVRKCVAATLLFETGNGYRQRKPQETVLYRVVADHLETFLDHVREHHERGLPAYVENEFRALLTCGIHSFG